MTDVAGGLDEPEELQPEPGALALASADDEWTRADWENAAAGVLRKARRLGADDPDHAVWQALARTTYDGISITPLGTPERVDDACRRPGVRRGPGAWDVRTANAGDNAAALHDLENGATSLGSTPTTWRRPGRRPARPRPGGPRSRHTGAGAGTPDAWPGTR